MEGHTKDQEQTDAAGDGPLLSALRRLGMRPGQVVVEFGYDDDVDEELREAVEALVEGPIEEDDYDGVTDVVLLWWREGDGDLTDELVDALTGLEEGGSIALLTPGAGRDDRVEAHDVQEACTICSLSASGAVPLGEWVGQRLVGRR